MASDENGVRDAGQPHDQLVVPEEGFLGAQLDRPHDVEQWVEVEGQDVVAESWVLAYDQGRHAAYHQEKVRDQVVLRPRRTPRGLHDEGMVGVLS